MSKKEDDIKKQEILPGFEDGRYEHRHNFDKNLFAPRSPEDLLKRDNRISIRVSGRDMTALQRQAQKEGIPTQNLLANIIHHYVNEQLSVASDTDADTLPEAGTDADLVLRRSYGSQSESSGTDSSSGSN